MLIYRWIVALLSWYVSSLHTHLQTFSASIREVMEEVNDIVKLCSQRLWVVTEKVPHDAAVTDVFDNGRAQVMAQVIA